MSSKQPKSKGIGKSKRKQNRATNLDEFGLKGPVKVMEQKVYKTKLKAGFIIQGEEEIHSYDEQTITAEFNEKGNKISEEMFWGEKGSSMKDFYDEEGFDYEHHYYNVGTLERKMYRKFNEAGDVMKLTHVDAHEKQTEEIVYEYDENGNVAVYKTYDGDSKLTATYYMKYDENGNKIDDKRFKGDGSFEWWIVFKYDDHGNNSETSYLNEDGSIKDTRKESYIYDSDGKCVGSNGRLWEKDAKLSYTEYEPDEHGNWTVKVGFHNKVPAVMVVRKLKYFGEKEINYDSDEKIKIPYNPDNLTFRERNELDEKMQDPAPAIHEMTPAQVQWMAENASADIFPVVRYYTLVNNDVPSTINYIGQDIEAIALLNELRRNMDAKLIFSTYLDSYSYGENRLYRYTLSFPNRGYLLQATQIATRNASEFLIPEFMFKHNDDYDGYVRTSAFMLYLPSDASGKRDENFEYEIEENIDLCSLEKAPDKPEISMVEVSDNNKFKLVAYPVHDNFLIKDLDMHYGYGFEKFHNELMNRFHTGTRGLVLFHGTPGTGKTYYIRHLLRKMTSHNKVVIYMPPNMVERLIDPFFMTFLAKEIARYSKQGFFCVLLIEDAEPLLASRQSDVRVQGISNLLNMTDGLLNDMLKLQIICTFNVKVKELDKALLRPGRLIARKEFKAMTTLDANRLAQQLGVKHHFDKPATLAEVYALVKNHNTLLHGEGETNLYD